MSWRQTPFAVGQRYLVKINFTSAFSHFLAGEMLVFEKEQYSHYDCSSVYVFCNMASGEKKEWWLHDDQPLESWQEYFQLVPFEDLGPATRIK
jgi:hypothetical protein